MLLRDNGSSVNPPSIEAVDPPHNPSDPRPQQLRTVNQQFLAQQIAKRQEAEAALRQAEQKYRSIFENAVEGIFQTSPDGRYISANPALARMYGYESPEALISQLTDIGRQLYVHPQRRDEFMRLMEVQGQVTEFESEVYRRDGQVIWISENARAVWDDAGKLLYCEGFVTEISDRKATEARLKASEAQSRAQAKELETTLCQLQQAQGQLLHNEKMSSLGQLVAGVAHEINNPVNFVCGNLGHASQYAQDLIDLLELYQKYYPDPASEIADQAEAIDLEFIMEDFPKTLSSMQIGADRIRQIVQSLRTFSRVDEAKMKPADLHEGLDSTLLILQNRLKAKGSCPAITVLKEYGDLPTIPCYAGLLNQVFMNILSNGIDALEEWQEGFPPPQPVGTIRITTELIKELPRWGTQPLQWAVIRIADNGPGIPADVRDRIFEPFYTTKPVGKGTGLGLAISYQIIVDKHGGEIACTSAPEQGTEFTIKLPIHSHP